MNAKYNKNKCKRGFFSIKIPSKSGSKFTFQEYKRKLHHILKNLEKSIIKLKIKLLSTL